MRSGVSIPLHVAAERDHHKLAHLLEEGADANAKDRHGNTALHIAVEAQGWDTLNHYECEHAWMVRTLLAYKADVNAINNDGWTPLQLLRSSPHRDDSWKNGKVARLLRDNGGYDFSCDFPKIVRKGDLAEIRALIESHPELMALKDREDNTFLHVAASNGCANVVRLLLAKNADVNSKRNGAWVISGWMPMHAAAFNGHPDVVELLLERGNIDAKHSSGGTALMEASAQGYDEVVKTLIAKGADVNARDGTGQTALLKACRGRRRNNAEEFIEIDSISVVQVLLDNGADVNIADRSGCTALMEASGRGHYGIVELLLKKNANANAMLKETHHCDGNTALMRASKRGDKRIVDLLSRYGASVIHGSIIAAVRQGVAEEVDALVKGSPELICETDEFGWMPIHLAAMEGHRTMIQVLLTNKANVNSTDKNGRTPLWWAAATNHKDVVELLLASGADVLCEDSSGSTPWKVAVEKGYSEVVAELLDHAKQRGSIAQVTDEDVERIALRDFGQTQISLVMWTLKQFGKQSRNWPSPRVRLAILKLADGDLDRLLLYTQVAIEDPRNVINPAEYPTKSFEDDWKQYCDWLTRR